MSNERKPQTSPYPPKPAPSREEIRKEASSELPIPCNSRLSLDDGSVYPCLGPVAEGGDSLVPKTPKVRVGSTSGVRPEERPEEATGVPLAGLATSVLNRRAEEWRGASITQEQEIRRGIGPAAAERCFGSQICSSPDAGVGGCLEMGFCVGLSDDSLGG